MPVSNGAGKGFRLRTFFPEEGAAGLLAHHCAGGRMWRRDEVLDVDGSVEGRRSGVSRWWMASKSVLRRWKIGVHGIREGDHGKATLTRWVLQVAIRVSSGFTLKSDRIGVQAHGRLAESRGLDVDFCTPAWRRYSAPPAHFLPRDKHCCAVTASTTCADSNRLLPVLQSRTAPAGGSQRSISQTWRAISRTSRVRKARLELRHAVANEGAEQFVQFYYDTFDSDRSKLAPLYVRLPTLKDAAV